MRLMFMFLSVFILHTTAATYAQEMRFSLNLKQSTVKDVLKEIETKSEFSFFYNDAEIDIDRVVDIRVRNENIESVLSKILPNCRYVVENRKIILIPVDKNSPDVPRSSQNIITVKGTVTDEYGDPLTGVNITIKGTSSGVVTDLDGEYNIQVSADAVLVYSFIGYTKQEIIVNGRTTIDVKLIEDALLIDEIVVVGYGSQRKSDLTGGIVSIDATKLEKVTTNSLLDKLGGQVAGLNITATTARPGDENHSIRVRGENSLSANNGPLIILDGIPYNGTLVDIDPDIVETLTVLKDASSAAIYGSRGSNGVILIQTKKGKKGAPTVTYKGQVGVQQPERRMNMMKGKEYIQYMTDYHRLMNGYTGSQLEPLNFLNPSERENYSNGYTTDWQDIMFRNALTHNHQVSLSGGTDATTYMASISHMDQKGVVENTGMQRTNVTINVTQVLNKWLTVGIGTQATQRETGGISPGIESGLKMSPYGIYKEENGNYYDYPMDQTLFSNPMSDVNTDHDKTRRLIFISSFADILLPVKGLSFRTNLGYSYRNTFDGKYYGRNTLTGKKVDGRAIIENEHYYDYTWENILKYENTFGKHKLDFTGLFSVQETSKKTSKQTAEMFVNDDGSYHNMNAGEANQVVESTLDETALISYMGRVNYNYDNRYLLTVTARTDGYSAFGENNKYAFFPSIAAAWNLSSEEFFAAEWVDMLKIRTSYGANGNQAINPYQTLNRLSLAKYTWGDGSIVNGTYIPTNGVGNPNLKWETTRTFNVGVDYSFFNGRVSGSLEVYVANTKDLLMSRTVPIMNGYRTIMDNVGQTRNKGVEISLNTLNVETNNFSWSTNVNFSLNRDKIIELRGDGQDDITNSWFIGKPLRVFYDYKVVGTWQENEADKAAAMQAGAVPGSAKLQDTDNNKEITSADKVIIGSKLPSFLLSMGNQMSYKNIYFSFLLNGVFGQTKELHDYNFDRWMPSFNYISGMKYWTPERPTNKMTSPAYLPFDKHSFYKDVNYVQIKNVTLGYSFDKKVLDSIGIKGLNVNFSINNLYTFTNVENFLNLDANDLDATYRNMIVAYPTTRSYIFGLNITF